MLNFLTGIPCLKGILSNTQKHKHHVALMDYKLSANSSIEVKNINFSYGAHKVVHDFSFDFKKNIIYTFIGDSASGKSTIVSHFNGLLKSPTANIYLWTGENIYSFNKKLSNFRQIRKEVGMVLQNPEYQLFKETVLEDVCCGLKMLKPELPDKELRGKEKLRELGVPDDLFDRNPFMLSGGQKKKIALAGILVIEPSIVIFDEPILGLDPYSSQKIVDIIYELKKQGKNVIVVSNNIDFLLEVGDEMLVIKEGKLIKSGKPYSIFRDKSLKLGTPQIIKFIEGLSQTNQSYSKLWDSEPRNCQELAEAIDRVIKAS